MAKLNIDFQVVEEKTPDIKCGDLVFNTRTDEYCLVYNPGHGRITRAVVLTTGELQAYNTSDIRRLYPNEWIVLNNEI